MHANLLLIFGSIGAILIVLVVIGLIAFWVSNARNKRKTKNSMPSFGTDRSEFAKDMQTRYRNESRPN
jgi:uncharacterized membrane protein